jgi:hypothetical protein
MRFAVLAAVLCLSACASEKLKLAPPPGVDFSGHWQLNVADSDDPMHLAQPASNPGAGSANAGSGGAGGRGSRGGAGGMGNPALYGPITPSFGAVGEALRWPGKALQIKQVAGVVAFTSDGKNRICQPSDEEKRPRHPNSNPSDPDAPLPAAREAPPPRCGWSDKTLIIQSRDSDDDRAPFEESYSLSEDGQRLIETVGFKGGRSNGFTVSRVWDRVQ